MLYAPDTQPVFDASKIVVKPFSSLNKTAEQISWEEIQSSRQTPFELMSLVRCSQEEFEKIVPFMSSPVKDNEKTCGECRVKLSSTNNFMPLSRPSSEAGYRRYLHYPLCEGCERLFKQVHSKKEKNSMLIWMLTGEFDRKITNFPPGYFKQKFKLVAKFMKKREKFEKLSEEEKSANKQERKVLRRERLAIVREERNRMKEEGTYVSRRLDIVSADELSALVEYTGYTCGILGWTCEMFDGSAFNYLTFDHIIPIHGKTELNKGSFCIGNIRPLCQVLNQTKKNLNDDELYRWLILLLRNYYHNKMNHLV